MPPKTPRSDSSILVVTSTIGELRGFAPEVPELVPGQLWRDGRFVLGITGVGKAAAAYRTACFVREHEDLELVVNIGVAGMYPNTNLSFGDLIVSNRSVFVDEGVMTPGGFVGIGTLGFETGFPGSCIPDRADVDRFLGVCDAEGPIATVSSGAGTDELATERGTTTGALAEGMEGGAVGFVCAELGVPWAEVRAISNTTGDRDRQEWDLQRAVSSLGRVRSALER